MRQPLRAPKPSCWPIVGNDLKTDNGALRLEDKHMSIRTEPGSILKNQARRVRRGALLKPLAVLVSAYVGGVAITIELARLFTALGDGESALLASSSVGLILLFIGYATYFAPHKIPLERINKIQVDPGNGTIAVDYDTPSSVTRLAFQQLLTSDGFVSSRRGSAPIHRLNAGPRGRVRGSRGGNRSLCHRSGVFVPPRWRRLLLSGMRRASRASRQTL